MRAAGPEFVEPEAADRDIQPARRRDLSTHLGTMLQESEAMLQQPLRPLTENLRGYVESVAMDSTGLLWVAGWLNKDHPLEFPAILVDRRKIPAAVVLTCYDRPDLPDDAHAVFGVVQADWRPSQNGGDVFLFFGADLRLYLRGVRPLRIVTAAQALELFEGVKSFCYGDRTSALQRMLSSVQNWIPETGRVAGFPVHVGADRVLVLPPFGCMIEGWVMSPLKPIQHFILKFGSCVLHSDPVASYFKARTDLADAFPHYRQLCASAGFVALFRGRLPAEELIDPILKIVFTDGSSTNHQIAPTALQRLGHSSPLDEALGFYPSLHHETFFPDFARAVQQEVAAKLVPPEAFVVAPAARAMIFAVPSDRSDAYLLFAEVQREVEQMAAPPGLVFVAGRGQNRSVTVTLFRHLAAVCAAPSSLFFVEDVDYALYGLPELLRAVGARRFLFTRAGVFLTPAGWKSAPLVLDGEDSRIDFLAPPDDSPPALTGTVRGKVAGSSACFAWSTAALAEWMPTMPLFIGGCHGDNGLRHARVRRVFHRGGTRRAGEAGPDGVVAAHINRDVAGIIEAATHV